MTSLPNEYMKDINYVEFNPDGRKLTEMTAKKWYFSKIKNQSVTYDFKYTVHKPDDRYWEMHADVGHVFHEKEISNIKKIELLDDVTLSLKNKNNKLLTKINGENVDFFPNLSRIQSKSYVHLDKESIISSGKGLIGTLDDNKFEILDDVKTTIKFDNNN
jgi:LPS export ABC transporter protein LptC